ncbi:MAG: tol-pal system-associated acyl-CoA thioesterase [Mariprofundus sp.]|nr:tol-pal system-associated acyl-CoA thioesterase [Mariprofundus sp.]
MTAFFETLSIRVYYEDTDHGGVVYYANYLKFMERARSEFLRSAGLELDSIEAEFGVLFAVTEANIRYHKPAVFNDLLTVESGITRLRGARITFRQHIYRQQGHILLTDADIHLACIDRNGKVSRIPAPIADRLKNHLNPS